MSWDGAGDGWDIVAREYSAAADLARQAWETLQEARLFITSKMDGLNLKEETLLTELFHRTMTSCFNTVCFLRARRDFERTGEMCHRNHMKEIARAEKTNALDAVPIDEAAPWLYLAHRTDGRFASCITMIEEKSRWIDWFV